MQTAQSGHKMIRNFSTHHMMRFFCLLVFLIPMLCTRNVNADPCPMPTKLGDIPTRLVVVVPATTQGPEEWQSFLRRLERDPQHKQIAWLVYRHDITYATKGSARNVAKDISACIDQWAQAPQYQSVTLIGHSIGGMLLRHAYLIGAGAMPGLPAAPHPWTEKVDRILLFSSVNRGVSGKNFGRWYGPVTWLARTFPHPHLIVEDFQVGSDFIADTRIAWIRYFGELQSSSIHNPSVIIPKVTQFWGTQDSVVTESDNSDLEAFSGPVLIRIQGANHRNLQQLDPPYTTTGDARWEKFRDALFENSKPTLKTYVPRRVLFIVRGIRDSSNSAWVSELASDAQSTYGHDNIAEIEYGYFSAAHFAIRPLRRKPLPEFRDRYAELLAQNPMTTFDFIGHSNGTYLLAQSLLSTPSMKFKNVVLAAPVLPVDFDWKKIFDRGQVKAMRYEMASRDWAVGILCPALRAIGFTDVGPAGVLGFGAPTAMQPGQVVDVGWYQGGHGESLRDDDNLRHLLNFAETGEDFAAGETVLHELGAMRFFSNVTPYMVWFALVMLAVAGGFAFRRNKRHFGKIVLSTLVVTIILYVLLDVI